MKKIINLTLIMILALSALKANAGVLMSGSEVKDNIVKQVLNQYKNYTDAELSVHVVALPFQNLDLPSGKVSFVVKSSENRFMPRDLEKVSVYVNDKLVTTFNAPIVVKAYQNVLVAASFINIGQQITKESVVEKRLEVSNTFDYQLKPEVLTREVIAKKAFREGEAIDKRFVKFRPDVLRNSDVTVYFNTRNLSIITDATALSDGVIGDNVCLINKNYNRSYTGKVIGENKVLVKL